MQEVYRNPRLGQLPLLKILEISGMDNVRCIGTEFYGKSREQIPFPSLKEFYLCSMRSLTEWMAPSVTERSDAIAFPQLCCLEISGCPQLTSIPASHLSSLAQLEIDGCEELSYLCDKFDAFFSLEDLRISYCHNLVSIPSLGGLTSLKTLKIEECPKLTSLPNELQSCTLLEHLSIIWCDGLTSIAENLSELCSLVYLEITNCPNLIYCPKDILCCLSQLKDLRIGPFSKELEYFSGLDSIQDLPLLEELRIFGLDNLNSFPDQLQYLTGLMSACIRSFNEVKSLPKWLENLSSLQYLEIWHCRNLMYLTKTTLCFSKLMRLHKCPVPFFKTIVPKGVALSGPRFHISRKFSSINFARLQVESFSWTLAAWRPCQER
ncbi:putative disease resistance RPP13-like protein 1 isoform X1 [Jatropha curcas]|uniref:putative disease resistance RPP13-like protein 1 isoform X1 n=1 Tax=Jatropha curcas TaxID=180498 RepID=UPI0009D70D6F|nr:putative disease resistance RPP13-like protein 1 isoform X1 [Jatropha curcas]XP_020540307.1 putative disease resistance RPP13-like protein 1 isoform X1 [Jatropha curcas]XP_020540311.1 putative disease resistance RPP13-like protein 1 isoform X1 [Jatropha curcas]XP_020540315.1 putative disease resistance RPP13-like protein 1 isoform X1 [Jatropha curcas]XP_020540318.1 putative disease resistance RPP13-like protein 1 isoform X1 [Jatropha curcas]XP_020540319.1 putative disease resistance RPP13-l